MGSVVRGSGVGWSLVGRSSMSLRLPQPVPPVPEDTARIARAAFPHGNPYLLLRDRLGPVFDDAGFTDLYSRRGQPTARHSASLWSDPGQPERANILQSLEVLWATRDYVPDAYLHRLRGKRRDRHLPGRRGHDLLGWQHALADQPMN